MMIRLPRLALSAAAFCAAAVSLSLPASIAAQETDPYSRLVGAVASEAISDRVFEQDMGSSFVDALGQMPEMADIEADCPGFITGYADAVTGIMRESHEYDYRWYRSQLAQLFRAEMTQPHARGAAEFFETDLAQRFFITAISQMTAENTVRDAIENEDAQISQEAQAADRKATARRTVEAMPPEDMRRFAEEMSSSDWFPSFRRLRPRINTLTLAMANRDFTPEMGAKYDRISDGFIDNHLAQCNSEK